MAAKAEKVNGHKAEAISLALEKFKKDGANVLLPSTRIEGLSEWHEPVIDQVTLSPDPKDGDVYLQEKGGTNKPAKYAISRQGLLKLSGCAGVIWHTGETRRVDNCQDKDYVCFQATGGVRKADGTPFFYQANYDLDFEVIEDEIEEGYVSKRANYDRKPQDFSWWHKMSSESQDAYINKCIRRDLLQKRKHKLKLAESGAMNRVIRALLSLKTTYTQPELEKPFVLARIIIKPDFNDKEVRKQLMTAAIQSMTGIYGGREALPEAVTLPHEEIIELPSEEEPIILPEGDEPEDDTPDGEPEGDDDPKSGAEADFRLADDDEQIKILMVLAKQKGYDLKSLSKPLAEFEQKHRLGFRAKLMEMDDDIPDDDIPF